MDSTGAMYGAGDEGGGIGTALTAGEYGEPGRYPYMCRVAGVGSSIAPVLVPGVQGSWRRGKYSFARCDDW